MDVWFDSGTSWSVVESMETRSIADVYLEGSDQYRGWFQSSLLTHAQHYKTSPYKTLIAHGFVVDENGLKMSKSLGNGVDPDTVINGGKNKKVSYLVSLLEIRPCFSLFPSFKVEPAYGADTLRMWAASRGYTSDMAIGPNILAVTAGNLRKIRNTCR
jgi:isoleucyl-tRNA synthetase